MNFNWFEKTKIMIFGQNQQNSIYFEISLQEYFQKTTKQSRKLAKSKVSGLLLPSSRNKASQ